MSPELRDDLARGVGDARGDGAAPAAGSSPGRLVGSGLAVLSVVLFVLFVIPSRLTFAPLGGAGSPPQILGMSLFLVWALRRTMSRARPTPLHWTLTAFAGSVLVSYLMSCIRPIDITESSGADRGLLAVLAWLGLFLTVAEYLTQRRNLDTFLRRIVLGGAFVAVVGLLQFATKQVLVDAITVPGLSDSSDLVLGGRNGFTRPQGTTIHPIEFGAVLTMVLPIALHYAMHDSARGLVRRWFPVAVIALAIPMSISRSAIISAAVILVALIPTWAPVVRRRAYAVMVVLCGVLYASVPGLLGTITGLFSGISTDDSTQSRTASYQLAGQFIERSPVFGRGFQTFLTSYRILDNEYLSATIQLGIVGCAVLLGNFVTAIVMCRVVRSRVGPGDPRTRSLAQALLASIASMSVSMAVFDALSFPMATNLLFLLLGAIAALWLSVRTPAEANAPQKDLNP